MYCLLQLVILLAQNVTYEMVNKVPPKLSFYIRGYSEIQVQGLRDR